MGCYQGGLTSGLCLTSNTLIRHCNCATNGHLLIDWLCSTLRSLPTQRYSALWERTGDHAVITIRPTIAQTLLRFKGVVQVRAITCEP